MNKLLVEFSPILASLGIGSLLTGILTFIQSSKRNNIEGITFERSEWRRSLKSLYLDISTSEINDELINRLKIHLNPYGKNFPIQYKNKENYYLKDGHIWDELEKKTINKNLLMSYIELLLKYDWDRTKEEINFKFENIVEKLINYIFIFISSSMFYIIFFDKNSNLILLSVNMLSLYFICFQSRILNFVKKRDLTDKIKKKSIHIVLCNSNTNINCR